jgi:hypothetical protein
MSGNGAEKSDLVYFHGAKGARDTASMPGESTPGDVGAEGDGDVGKA